MDQLTELKKLYNAKLERNKKAEEYFTQHNVEQCMKQLNLFNQVVQELSSLIKQIEGMTYRKMTNSEILNGFKV